jgi:filamentous hemagglutinin
MATVGAGEVSRGPKPGTKPAKPGARQNRKTEKTVVCPLFTAQFNYAKGSFWDKLAETYAGPHDTLNSPIWYDDLGNGKNLKGSLIGTIGEVTNTTNVVIATPFALSTLLPPELWNAIATGLKAIK